MVNLEFVFEGVASLRGGVPRREILFWNIMADDMAIRTIELSHLTSPGGHNFKTL